MTKRKFNFSAGPATLPESVLERARDGLLSYGDTGIGVMEMSHRSRAFEEILGQAENGIRNLLSVPDNYRILFMQGGASLQFAMVPLNFLRGGRTADHIVTGAWGKKAVDEASRRGNVNVIHTTENTGFRSLPDPAELNFSSNAEYIHYTSNETIHGVEFPFDLEAGGLPVVCDASSNILSKPIDVEKYAFIYAGAQKNIGPSGVTVVIISEEFLEKADRDQYSMLNYHRFSHERSMPNTPNTWGIFIISLVMDWLGEQGGLSAIAFRNSEKASRLYNAIDASDGFYTGHSEVSARSKMNVTFRLPNAGLDDKFGIEAAAAGLDGLKGHRSMGGIRASIYNAFPSEGVDELISFMDDFARRYG
jgi:phosphoserine aminotransferase